MNALLRALNIAIEHKDREIATLQEDNLKLVEENIEKGEAMKRLEMQVLSHQRAAPLPELNI